MSDIIVCDGDGCPRKNNCYRYLCEKEELGQSYFLKPPLKNDSLCNYYLRIK